MKVSLWHCRRALETYEIFRACRERLSRVIYTFGANALFRPHSIQFTPSSNNSNKERRDFSFVSIQTACSSCVRVVVSFSIYVTRSLAQICEWLSEKIGVRLYIILYCLRPRCINRSMTAVRCCTFGLRFLSRVQSRTNSEHAIFHHMFYQFIWQHFFVKIASRRFTLAEHTEESKIIA